MEEEVLIPEEKPVVFDKKLNRSLFVLTILSVVCSIMFLLLSIIPHYTFSENKLSFIVDSVKNVNYIISIGLIILFVIHLIFKSESNLKLFRIIKNILEYIIICPVVFVIYSYVFTFGLSFATVDGPSMEDTLHNGDQVVLLFTNDFERNDIVVFHVTKEHYKNNSEKFFVKRIIGVPGDTIQYVVKEDRYVDLYVNGEFRETYRETQINLDNMVLDKDGNYRFTYHNNGETKNTFKIPNGYYFCMGDNRENSNDSRGIGLVHYEDLVGVVRYRTINDSMFNWEGLE